MSSQELVDERAFELLYRQVKRRRWATTYLFTGEELTKKKALAFGFARALNCNQSPFHFTCRCSICERIEKGVHPDVKWYGLDEEASSIKISEVRDFKNWLALKPYEGRVKVFIFQGADRLTAEAQNALLKSLEEPPPGNVILLLVNHARALFDTIVSRAVEIRVPSFSIEKIKDVLAADGIDAKEAGFLARIAQGNLGRARQFHEDGWFKERNQWLEGLVEDPLSFLEQFQTVTRSELARVFDFLVEWVRDLLVLHATGDNELLIDPEAERTVKLVVSNRDFDSLFDLFQNLIQIRKAIDENVNQKLTLTRTEILLKRFFQHGQPKRR